MTSGRTDGPRTACSPRSGRWPARSRRAPTSTPWSSAVGDARFVCLGEASHGTHEFYTWRAALSRRLIEEKGFTFIAVEGDWPDCWRINRWVRGLARPELDARGRAAELRALADLDVGQPRGRRLPRLAARSWNLARPAHDRVGFYGLDVYSLWDSLREIIDWLGGARPRRARRRRLRAWQCFEPYGEDPQRYAWSTRLVPESCENEVVALLVEVRRRTPGSAPRRRGRLRRRPERRGRRRGRALLPDDGARRPAVVERPRPAHGRHARPAAATTTGPGAKGLVWEHNTHVGDARATDMAGAGHGQRRAAGARAARGRRASRWSASPATAAP